MAAILGVVAFPFAFLVVPYLLVCHLRRRRDPAAPLHRLPLCAALWLCVAPLALMAADQPVTRLSLAAVHIGAGLLLALAAGLRRLNLRLDVGPDLRRLVPAAIVLFVLVLPITHLAGVDTYRWQSMATAIRMERSIPWLVHPASLFGFGPRAYPIVQPVALATAQMLGGLGVDAGFFVVSLFTAFAGLVAAHRLGRLAFADPKHAVWFASLYVLSPVFLRYTHWATGRGFFLAFLPLVIAAMLDRRRPALVVEGLLAALLLLLCHKTAWPALPVVALAALGALLTPSRLIVRAGCGLAAGSLLASLLVSPGLLLPGLAGRAAGLVRYDVARFALLSPLAWMGLAALAARPTTRRERCVLLLFLLAYPLAHDSDMYGALIALPPVVLLAVEGLRWAQDRLPARVWRTAARALAAAALAAAFAVVIQRSVTAAPSVVRRAAAVIQAHDPEGPFLVEAPGYARKWIQAYVDGCPRFRVWPRGTPHVVLAPLPPPASSLQGWIRDWTAWARNAFVVEDLGVSWYGDATRTYHVTIGERGAVPPGAALVARERDFAVYLAESPASP